MKEGWETKKLVDICKIQYGYPFDSKQFCDDSKYPQLIRIRDVSRGYSETYFSGEIPEGYYIDKGDYLIGMDGEFNIAAWNSERALLNQRVCKITANNEAFDRFLYYNLRIILKQIEDETPFVTVKHLSAKRLNGVTINLPPLSEQKYIVNELDLLSSIIEKKKAQIKELDNLAQSLFYEMFGDPIINNMEWEVKTLKELVYIGLGFTHTPQYVEKGVPFISVKDISSGYIDLSKIKYVSKEDYDNAPKGAKPQKGDLMFCRVGTMGKPLIVETDMQFCTFVSVGYMRRLQNNIDMSFLKYWMLSNSFDKQVEANVRGLAIKNLNTGWLKNFSIYLPPLSIQQQFAEKVEAIEHQKELIKQSIKEVETLFNSRMDYYFN